MARPITEGNDSVAVSALGRASFRNFLDRIGAERRSLVVDHAEGDSLEHPRFCEAGHSRAGWAANHQRGIEAQPDQQALAASDRPVC
jgi:hypothetical protein